MQTGNKSLETVHSDSGLKHTSRLLLPFVSYVRRRSLARL